MALFQAQHLWVHEATDGVAELVLDGQGKTNELDRAVLDELRQALAVIEKESRFQLCVVRSKKSASFCHGVEPATWTSLKSPEAWDSFAVLGQQVCSSFAQLRVPTVALVNGACLGGGLELALACDWRVAMDAPTTLLGFTELEVGLLPSWGGIARLLHLVGLERGLQILLGGKKLTAPAAHAWGLIDAVVPLEADMDVNVMSFARKRTTELGHRRTWRQHVLEATGWGRRLILRGAERVLRRRLPDEMLAPLELLAAIRAVSSPDSAPDDDELRNAMNRLATSQACGNLLRLHELRDRLRLPSLTAQRPRQIGILGATPLALHLAAQAAIKGCQVTLRERDELTLGAAVLRLVQSLQEDAARGQKPASLFQANVNRIRPTVSWKHFEELELVIDAIDEANEADQRLTRELERHAPKATVVSIQPWRALAAVQAGMAHPERVVGLHFPAPVGRAPLVEILTAPTTSPEAIQRVRGFAELLGKATIVAPASSGGLILRVLCSGFGEAIRMLQEGMELEQIELAMQRFGMVYAPLEHLDALGIEEFALIVRRLEPVLGEAMTESPIIEYLIHQRWLGMKTGVGFHRYVAGKLKPNRPLTRWLHRQYAGNTAPMSHAERKKFIQDRLVGRMVNESFRCLDEGASTIPDELDASLMLVGWAPHRGGPCRFAQQTGYAAMVDTLDELANRHGSRFAPSAFLKRLASGLP